MTSGKHRGGRSISWLNLRSVVLVLLLIIIVVSTAKDDDLYKILGVTKTATVKEIKQAYRRKAKDTHPDKRDANTTPEEAAEAFRKVVDAFEILSDESSRRRYDQTGRRDGDGGFGRRSGGGAGGGFQHSWSWTFHSSYGGGRRRAPMKLKDKFEVKQAMARVMHIVSLEQLRTVMLDDDDLLERDLLLCFCTPGDIETHVDDEMVFPYPFAAQSSQGIWWEDLLQTVKVRYHRGNELTRFLQVPEGDDLRQSGQPVFLFVKKGQPLHPDSMTRLQTRSRQEFETWTWRQIQVRVNFVNQHAHPVEIYWIHGTRAHIKTTLQAGRSWEHTTMLAHEWYVRDARVDTRKDSPGRWKLSTESSLGSWKIGVEGPYKQLEDGMLEIVIYPQSCFDLSGHCKFWYGQGECSKNPRFMEETCPLTCKLCERGKVPPPPPPKDKESEGAGTGDEL